MDNTKSFTLRRVAGFVVFGVVVLAVWGVLPLKDSSPSPALAQTEELVFKSTINSKGKRRKVPLKNCSLIDGSNRAIVSARGRTVSLERKLRREPADLGGKYRFFACGDNGTGEDSLFAKETADSDIVEFDLDEADFPEAQGGEENLDAVCNRVRDLSNNEIYKAIGSHHFSDCRRTTAGIVVAPGGSNLGDSCLDIYDSEGNDLGDMGAYFPAGPPWVYRAYACWGCSKTQKSGAALASQARKNTGSSSIYIRYGGTCIRIPDAAKCYNSRGC